jgi:hypothetical protein
MKGAVLHARMIGPKLVEKWGQPIVMDNARAPAASLPFSRDEFDKLVHDEIRTRMKVWKAAGVKPE